MDVLNLRYMKRIRFTLRSIGAWPSHVFGNASTSKWSPIRRYGYTLFLCILCSLGMVAQMMYITKNLGIVEFVDLGQTCLTLLLCCVYVLVVPNPPFRMRGLGRSFHGGPVMIGNFTHQFTPLNFIADVQLLTVFSVIVKVMQRTLLPLQGSYAELIKEFAFKFNLFHHKHNSDYSAKMYNRVNKICEIATNIQHVLIYTTAIMYNVGPLYANYRDGMLSSNRPKNGTFDFSVDYVLPVDQTKVGWFTLITLYNCYCSYNLGSMFCCHDLQICVVVFHIWGHLKIFEHNLNSFPKPSAAKLRYSNEETKDVAIKLKEIVKYYIMIKEFVGKTSEAYNITLCVYYAFHLVGDCVLLLECSTGETAALAKYGLLTVGMYQLLMQLSVVFELISSKGDSLIDTVYGLPWEYMDTSNRRTVLILLQIVQQSLALKACNMVPVGVQTMLAIMKASFSYFMMLRTFAQL